MSVGGSMEFSCPLWAHLDVFANPEAEMVTKPIVRLCNGLNVSPSGFMSGKLNPQSHILMLSGGSEWIRNYLVNRLLYSWINGLMGH